ncbi:MAG: NUDIX hydrolase [Calditrichaeota bacterium]|nr:NUDIX hydrolase [Calditrichota bacterium]
MSSQWLRWAKRLNAIAQAGLTYSEGPYDLERYHQLRDIAGEIIAGHSNLPPAQIVDILRREAGYPTPKVDVRGAVFRNNQILLVRERSDGRWTLPGGWADVNETPAECVVKEVREESGYHTRAVKLLAVWDKSQHSHPEHFFHTYKLFFRCEITGGAPAESLETDGVAFFNEDSLPPLSIDRTTSEQIRRMFVHYRNPDLATEFD